MYRKLRNEFFCNQDDLKVRFLYLLSIYCTLTLSGLTKEIEDRAKKAVEILYGSNIQQFKIRELLPFPNETKREAWDVQTTFLLNKLQYTVDLLIQENNGHITNARLIDTMIPI